MSEVKYGELTGWEDGEVLTSSDFLNLSEGNNKLRVFTKPYQFVVHWVKDVTGVNRKIKCAIENCPLCRQGIKAQYRWFVGVIDRKSGQPKVLEISSQIFKGIREYNSDPDWGDVTKYDLNIRRGPKGAQPLYTVLVAAPKKSNLTSDESELVEVFLNRVNISKFTHPLTPQEIEQKLGEGNISESPKVTTGNKSSENTTRHIVDDDEFNFGDEENT